MASALPFMVLLSVHVTICQINYANISSYNNQILRRRRQLNDALSGGFPSPSDDFGTGTDPQGYKPHQVTTGKLYDFGRKKLSRGQLQSNRLISLGFDFYFTGTLYNYTFVSKDGYVTFANAVMRGGNMQFGMDTKWPDESDPATIGVYVCDQEFKETPDQPAEEFYRSGVYYQTLIRRQRTRTDGLSNSNDEIENDNFVLDQISHDLRDATAGASFFTAQYAFLVTWVNMTTANEVDQDGAKQSTYQTVLTTNGDWSSSYVIVNYDKLGYKSSDMNNGPAKACQAKLNSGNHTGFMSMDSTLSNLADISMLASMSAAPHQAAGRYLFRVHDILERGGCSNVSAGDTMYIYPNIINMLGTTAEINGPCLSEPFTIHMMEEEAANCVVINPSKGICEIILNYNMGPIIDVRLKTDSNANFLQYKGTVYYVPPTEDPHKINIVNKGSGKGASDWFMMDPTSLTLYFDNLNEYVDLTVSQYSPLLPQQTLESKNAVGPISAKLELYGYRESPEPDFQLLATLQDNIGISMDKFDVLEFLRNGANQIQFEENVRSHWQSYQLGFFKLSGGKVRGENNDYFARKVAWTPPVALRWLFLAVERNRIEGDADVKKYARMSCIKWFDTDGAMGNFIRVTETHAPCPCKDEQAAADYGRFMPHPRCHYGFSRVTCEMNLGSANCYISVQSVRATGAGSTNHGQVCCYGADGYLLISNYKPLAESQTQSYHAGFPQRAYEFGTAPFHKKFQVPVLSHYVYDVMPYFYCCDWSPELCKFFYWRRPTSTCQNYDPPSMAKIFGFGHVITFDNAEYTITEAGSYVLLHRPATKIGVTKYPKVEIQARFENYPDRSVNFRGQDMTQKRLVQPVSAIVVTGLALQDEQSSLVQVVVRKDTRRQKRRTDILVDGKLHDLTSVNTKQFAGVTIYIEGSKEGQSEIYVALSASKVGVKITESETITYETNEAGGHLRESYGQLDVEISVPSYYNPNYRNVFEPLNINDYQDIFAKPIIKEYETVLSGLLGTFTGTPDDDNLLDRTTSGTRLPSTEDGLSQDSIQQFLRAWKSSASVHVNAENNPFSTMFQSGSSADYREKPLIKPVYPASGSAVQDARLVDTSYQAFLDRREVCRKSLSNRNSVEANICPSKDVTRVCSTAKSICYYDYLFGKYEPITTIDEGRYAARVSNFKDKNGSAASIYTSCGSVNIEYPEKMNMRPFTGNIYLDGAEIKFGCYASGWIKGDPSYKCNYGSWNKGWQPWCRSRSLERVFRGLSIFFGIVLCAAPIIGILICCYCCYVRPKKHPYQSYKGEPRRLGAHGPVSYNPQLEQPISMNHYAISPQNDKLPPKEPPIDYTEYSDDYNVEPKVVLPRNERLVDGDDRVYLHRGAYNYSPNSLKSSNEQREVKMTTC